MRNTWEIAMKNTTVPVMILITSDGAPIRFSFVPPYFTKVNIPEYFAAGQRGDCGMHAITFITLFGYAAMAGCVGAGGLGDIAIRYGYQRYKVDVMVVSVVLCVILVQVIQSVGDVIARKTDKRTR